MIISDEKTKFINDFVNAQKVSSQEELLNLLIKFQQKASQNNIKFSKDEILYFYQKISKDLTNDERSKALKIINML